MHLILICQAPFRLVYNFQVVLYDIWRCIDMFRNAMGQQVTTQVSHVRTSVSSAWNRNLLFTLCVEQLIKSDPKKIQRLQRAHAQCFAIVPDKQCDTITSSPTRKQSNEWEVTKQIFMERNHRTYLCNHYRVMRISDSGYDRCSQLMNHKLYADVRSQASNLRNAWFI